MTLVFIKSPPLVIPNLKIRLVPENEQAQTSSEYSAEEVECWA
jgi:hypothetical protein